MIKMGQPIEYYVYLHDHKDPFIYSSKCKIKAYDLLIAFKSKICSTISYNNHSQLQYPESYVVCGSNRGNNPSIDWRSKSTDSYHRNYYHHDSIVEQQIVEIRPNFMNSINVRKLLKEYPEFRDNKKTIERREDLYYDFKNRDLDIFAYKEFGCNKYKSHENKERIVFKEWIPNVKSVKLVINENQFNMIESPKDIWHFETLIDENCDDTFYNKQYHLLINTKLGWIKKMSPWTKYYKQYDMFTKNQTCAAIVDYNEEYSFKYPHINNKLLNIYEVHIGIAQHKKGIGSYKEFTERTLPYIKNTGYNCIQLMGILEHPHYSTFGYQPNFIYAPSSRFGSSKDLKKLIDKAHSLGIKVILDIMLGHSVSNIEDGIIEFNGNENCFFKDKKHPIWKCSMFDHDNSMVTQYLISNLIYWVEEYMIDGFRFDATTSILFKDYGAHRSAEELMSEFWTNSINLPGVMFLRLSNEILHKRYPEFMITIAEDVSGYPGLCSKYGLGFDYQLGMHIPDIMSKILSIDMNNPKLYEYNEWDMNMMVDYFLKPKSTYITYTESHDQAFVGSCTIFQAIAGKFGLIPKYCIFKSYEKLHIKIKMAMQFSMMFRLLTHSLANSSLTFIGNEFGHPLWIEFPSEDNELSFDKCHRKWNLLTDDTLIFKYLHRFECRLNYLSISDGWYTNNLYEIIELDNEKQVIIYKKLNQYFIYCFHTTLSATTYELYINSPKSFHVATSTQQEFFGGSGLIEKGSVFKTRKIYSDKMRNTRLSRQNEKSNSFNYDYVITIPIIPLCGYILQSI